MRVHTAVYARQAAGSRGNHLTTSAIFCVCLRSYECRLMTLHPNSYNAGTQYMHAQLRPQRYIPPNGSWLTVRERLTAGGDVRSRPFKDQQYEEKRTRELPARLIFMTTPAPPTPRDRKTQATAPNVKHNTVPCIPHESAIIRRCACCSGTDTLNRTYLHTRPTTNTRLQTDKKNALHMDKKKKRQTRLYLQLDNTRQHSSNT